jgi:predicted nucleotidyltransferase
VRGSAPSREANSAWEAAELAAASLSALPDIQGVLLFGSVARRRSDPDSDIDMLVVGTTPGLMTGALLAALPANLRKWHLSIQYYTTGELAELFAAGPAFTDHLRREGVVLYDRDGRLGELISSPGGRAISIDDEIALQLSRLGPLEAWPQYNGNFLVCLAELYAIARAVVILVLARSDAAEFDHRTIFSAYRTRYPERGADVDTVAELAPFARLVAGRGGELPFSYRDAEDQAGAAVAAIRRLAAP